MSMQIITEGERGEGRYWGEETNVLRVPLPVKSPTFPTTLSSAPRQSMVHTWGATHFGGTSLSSLNQEQSNSFFKLKEMSFSPVSSIHFP